MTIERRLTDRNADATSNRWLWKLFVLAILATIAVYAFLKHKRLIHS